MGSSNSSDSSSAADDITSSITHKSLKETLGDEFFVKDDRKIITFDEGVKSKSIIGLYFSAHWCMLL